MTHSLLEQLAVQRQDVLAARARAHHPNRTQDGERVQRRTSTRSRTPLSLLAIWVGR